MRAIHIEPLNAGFAAALALLLCIAIAPRLGAVETLSAADLAELCAAEAEAEADGTINGFGSCRNYILGFLEGAIVTDPRVAMGVADQIESEDSFQARAYRTRLGRDLVRLGPSYLAGFCVPDSAPLRTITSRVVDALPSTPSDEPARELVYRVLKSDYPCGSPQE